MTSSLRSSRASWVKCVATAATLAVAASASMALPSFTFDPSAVGLSGSAFTADNLLISNFSTVTSGAGGSFTESGYLAVGAVQLGGTTFTPAGLNDGYGLYIAFSGAGTTTMPGNPGSAVTAGSLSSLSYTIYGYNGPATFGFSGNTPTETALNEVALATGSLVFGSVATIPSGDGTSFSPSANVKLTFSVLEPAFFQAPAAFYDIAMTAFSNTASQVETFAGGFRIRQGGGTVNFAASVVPEPSTYAMLLAGLVAVGFVARRRRSD